MGIEGAVCWLRAGLSRATLQQAFGIDPAVDITQFNALADAIQNPGGTGIGVLKASPLWLPCFKNP